MSGSPSRFNWSPKFPRVFSICFSISKILGSIELSKSSIISLPICSLRKTFSLPSNPLSSSLTVPVLVGILGSAIPICVSNPSSLARLASSNLALTNLAWSPPPLAASKIFDWKASRVIGEPTLPASIISGTVAVAITLSAAGSPAAAAFKSSKADSNAS